MVLPHYTFVRIQPNAGSQFRDNRLKRGVAKQNCFCIVNGLMVPAAIFKGKANKNRPCTVCMKRAFSNEANSYVSNRSLHHIVEVRNHWQPSMISRAPVSYDTVFRLGKFSTKEPFENVPSLTRCALSRSTYGRSLFRSKLRKSLWAFLHAQWNRDAFLTPPSPCVHHHIMQSCVYIGDVLASSPEFPPSSQCTW